MKALYWDIMTSSPYPIWRIIRKPLGIYGVTAMLLFGLGPTWAADAAIAKKPFHDLATRIAESDKLARYDFASIALDELITAYQKSYRESAFEQHQKSRAQLKLARWRRESKSFIDQLKSQVQALSYQSRIDIEPDHSGPLIIFVDNTPIVISGPEIAEAGSMEQRIIDRYCQLHDCAHESGEPPTKTPSASHVPRGGWRITHRQGAIYETGDGLIFVFRTLDDRADKQARCETIARDLRILVEQIQKAQRAGYSVEWEQLTIATLHDGITEQVVINRAGDYLNMDLNYFGQQRGLAQPFLGWAAQRSAGKAVSVVIADAEKLIR